MKISVTPFYCPESLSISNKREICNTFSETELINNQGQSTVNIENRIFTQLPRCHGTCVSRALRKPAISVSELLLKRNLYILKGDNSVKIVLLPSKVYLLERK